MNTIQNFIGYKKVFSIFPELYNYKEFAPLLLRCSIGIIFFFSGWNQFGDKSGTRSLNISIGLLKMVIGIFLTVGMYLQIFALIGIFISIYSITLNIQNREGVDAVICNLLILIISFSLLLTGPGLFAFDLPM